VIPEEFISNFRNFSELKFLKIPSTTNDECHYDLLEVSDEDGEQFSIDFCNTPYLHICVNRNSKEISEEMYKGLKAWAKENCKMGK